MLDTPLSQISTSRRFLSRLSSTIFFRDLDILSGSGEERTVRKQLPALSRTAAETKAYLWAAGRRK